MNKFVKELYFKAGEHACSLAGTQDTRELTNEKFAELIVQQCIDIIETYRIPCGNSAAGELACEWTYDALKDIRDEINEKFAMNDEDE